MNLANKRDCTGCGACVNICENKALVMQSDKCGFMYPELIGECIDCGKCMDVCPLLNSSRLRRNEGDVLKVYAAITKDEKIRAQSSSGGVFSLLALDVLNNGGAVYGAAYDEKFAVRHICVNDPSELEKLRGAKYAQSDVCDCFEEIRKRLVRGQFVLFSGTPCQCAGLFSFLGKKYDNLLLIDTVCHSVPSPLVWKRYVQHRAKKDNNGILPYRINLRSKCTGWSCYAYSNLYEYPGGRQYFAKPTEDLYMKLFIGGYINRKSCEDCKFKGFDRISDITLGDFWGIWDICPEMDDNKGTSLLLIHSSKGDDMIRKLLKEKGIFVELNCEDAVMHNPAIIRSMLPNENRKKIISEAINGDFEKIEKSINSKRESFIHKIKRRLYVRNP